MQISSTPTKWTIPFATNDSAKVEIPATTSDPTRFSLSLGSPPLTGQPPETGGVPPQLEDFNGAMNQVARFTWWAIGGGPLPYDAVWSADPNVNGYANGAQIPTADGQGRWISIVDNNPANPDTTGTNWVPGFAYGALALTGQVGGTTTLTPAQAIKRTVSVAGALTSNLTIVVPAWVYDWTVTNNTIGAFTVTVKTASGSGVIIPQNGAPTRVTGDGTNVTQLAQNIAAATAANQAATFSQVAGVAGTMRNLVMSVTAASASATMTADEIVVETALGGLRYCLANFNKTINLATTGAGGMDTGTAPVSGYVALYAIYNPTTGASALLGVNATSTAVPTIYGGSSLPAGYTASALVSVWSTNASSQFNVAYQRDRHIEIVPINFLSTSTLAASPTAVSLAGAVPRNAVAFYANATVSYTGGTAGSQSVSSYLAALNVGTGVGIGTATGVNYPTISSGTPSARNTITVPQTTYYVLTVSAGPTPTVNYFVNSYDF